MTTRHNYSIFLITIFTMTIFFTGCRSSNNNSITNSNILIEYQEYRRGDMTFDAFYSSMKYQITKEKELICYFVYDNPEESIYKEVEVFRKTLSDNDYKKIFNSVSKINFASIDPQSVDGSIEGLLGYFRIFDDKENLLNEVSGFNYENRSLQRLAALILEQLSDEDRNTLNDNIPSLADLLAPPQAIEPQPTLDDYLKEASFINNNSDLGLELLGLQPDVPIDKTLDSIYPYSIDGASNKSVAICGEFPADSGEVRNILITISERNFGNILGIKINDNLADAFAILEDYGFEEVFSSTENGTFMCTYSNSNSSIYLTSTNSNTVSQISVEIGD